MNTHLSFLRARGCLVPPLLLLSLLASPALAQFPQTLRDDRGTEHRFVSPPQRIVTLLPSHSEAIWVLGGGSKLVGVDRFTNWPPAIDRLPRLGGLEDALVESIASLKPDLVIASPVSRSIDRLEALGFKVLRMKSETHEDVHRTLEQLAQLLQQPGEGERTWLRLMDELATARARVPASLRGKRVYFEIGGGSHAAGSASFIGQTLAQLGLVNVVPREMGPFPRMNPEFVVRAEPEIVIGQQRDIAAMAARPGWSSIPAHRTGRVCGFAPEQFDVLIRPGPRLGEAALLLADCLQRIAP